MFHGASIALRTFNTALFSPGSRPRAALVFLAVTAAGVAAYLSDAITRSQLTDIGQWALFPGTPLLALALSDLPLREPHTGKTLLYLVISPVSRPSLAVMRTLAAAVMASFILMGIVLITTTVTQQWSMSTARQLGAIAAGSAFYMAFFGLIQLKFQRGLFAGISIYFLLDVPLARLPAELSMLAPSWHLRVLAGPEFISEVARAGSSTLDPLTSLLTLVMGSLVFMILTVVVFSRKDLGDLC